MSLFDRYGQASASIRHLECMFEFHLGRRGDYTSVRGFERKSSLLFEVDEPLRFSSSDLVDCITTVLSSARPCCNRLLIPVRWTEGDERSRRIGYCFVHQSEKFLDVCSAWMYAVDVA